MTEDYSRPATLEDFLSRDMTAHPEQIRGMGPEWAARIQSLVAGVKVDLQAPLATGDE